MTLSPSRTAMRSLLALGVLLACSRATEPAKLPPVKHVFVIVLENKGFETTFGPGTKAPYFADTLAKAGAFLRQYYGIGHSSLDNYIAMISGIAPTPETQADCGVFADFQQRGMAPLDQASGKGCVYPLHVQTLATQLTRRGLTWAAYMEDMGLDLARDARATCAHPAIGTADPTEGAAPGDQYATKHNPFVYFHSIIDLPSCDSNVVALPRLETDLQSAARTANYTFISPNLCHDGHDTPCVNGEPGGLVSADAFLRHWVPLITGSPAYRDGGLLIITFDESNGADAAACCGEQPGPNVDSAGVRGPGGGRTGAVLLSPFIAAGTVSDVPYNHYSMLRSVEDIFGLARLSYAAQPGLKRFGDDVFRRGTR
jgi:Phosphoesterase family.